MSRLRSGVLMIIAAVALALSLSVAVPAADETPSAVKKVVMVGPSYARTLTVRGSVALRANVPESAGPVSVIFYLNGNGVGTTKDAPYRVEWDTTSTPDGEYLLKSIASGATGEEIWTGEVKVAVANKTPEAPPTPVVVAVPPAPKPPTAASKPATKPAIPAPAPVARTTKPAAKPPVIAAKPPASSVKPPAVTAAKPSVSKTTKPPVVVAAKPPAVTAAKPPAPKPAPPALKPPAPMAPKPPAVKPPSPPKPPAPAVSKPKPPAPKPAQVTWKNYTNEKYRFTADYPGTAQVRNESSHMRPKGPGSFWIAFTQTAGGKPWYAINVRHIKVHEPGSPDKFAKYNPYLLKWDRTNVGGIDGFKTISGRSGSKRVIHRTLLVDDRDVWMLNLTDVSGNDANVTGAIFKRFVESFRPSGRSEGPGVEPVAPAPPFPAPKPPDNGPDAESEDSGPTG